MRSAGRVSRLVALIGVLSPALASTPAGVSQAADRVVDLGAGVKMELAPIPAGTFTMGSTPAQVRSVLAAWPKAQERWFTDELPAHRVTITKAFWMGRHEVTVAQFRRFVQAAGYRTDAEKGTKFKGALVIGADGDASISPDASWRNPGFRQGDSHPVVCVSWQDAQAMVDWLNAVDKARPAGAAYRLPTEAQWEYACRAGTTTAYQWGDDPRGGKGWCNGLDLTANKTMRTASAFAWDDGFLYTSPVGSFRANAWGLYDMHGNVLEWCQDWLAPYPSAAQSDPAGPATGTRRVVRGGSWYYEPWTVRSAHRNKKGPTDRDSNTGFRVVLWPGR